MVKKFKYIEEYTVRLRYTDFRYSAKTLFITRKLDGFSAGSRK